MAFRVALPPATLDPQPPEPIIIMHGLLGSKNNWNSLAKAIANRTHQKVYTVDARNHGESPHTDEFSYAHLAEDVKYFIETEKMKQAHVIGHSMGGRAMMYLALKYPKLVASLIVVDISPISISPTLQEMSGLFDAMKAIDLSAFKGQPLPAVRSFLDHLLTKVIENPSVRQFVMTNLKQIDNQDHPVWQCNLDSLQKNFFTHMVNFTMPAEDSVFNGLTLFIKGGRSDFVRVTDYAAILMHFPKVDIVSIDDAGHWVHTQKPSEFVHEVVSFYKRLPELIMGL